MKYTYPYQNTHVPISPAVLDYRQAHRPHFSDLFDLITQQMSAGDELCIYDGPSVTNDYLQFNQLLLLLDERQIKLHILKHKLVLFNTPQTLSASFCQQMAQLAKDFEL